MNLTQKPVAYRRADRRELSAFEVKAAKERLRRVGQVDASRLVGELSAIITLLSMEPVGPNAFELIREAQADIEAFNDIIAERETRWTYNRDDAPAETTLTLDDVDGFAVGRAVKL